MSCSLAGVCGVVFQTEPASTELHPINSELTLNPIMNMDMQTQQDTMAMPAFENNFVPQHGNMPDQDMGGTDDHMGSAPAGGYTNGYTNGQQQQLTSHPPQSVDYPSPHQGFSTTPEVDANGRYPSPNMSYQQQPMQPMSRPSSGLSGSGDRYGYSQTYQEQNQRSSHQVAEASRNKNSVVIKVGMVGDAQIGKTSLMVKYVEGSWDEDYIQTLGRCASG